MKKIKLEKIIELKKFLRKFCKKNGISDISFSTVYGGFLNGNLRICRAYKYIYQDKAEPFPPSIDIESIDIGDKQ